MTERRIRIAALLAALLIALSGTVSLATDNESAPDPHLSADERARLVDMLEASRSATEALAAQAMGDRWAEKPAEDRWSVGEVIEHLALAEERLFGMVHAALGSEPAADWTTVAGQGIDGLVTMVQDRSQKFQAPDELSPTGEAGRADVLARYAAARVKTLDFVRATQLPVKQHTATGPPGTMNVHQWLALVAAHNLRHNKQIEEVLADIGG